MAKDSDVCKGRSGLDTQTLDWLMNISIIKEFGVRCAIKFTLMKARRNGFSARFAAAIDKLVREEGEDDGDDEAVYLGWGSSMVGN